MTEINVSKFKIITALCFSILVTLSSRASSLDQYVIIESGKAESSSTSNTFISEWTTRLTATNNTATSYSILYGKALTGNLSLELGYSNAGDAIIFQIEDNSLIQETETYNLQARYLLGTINRFSFSAHLGLARWNTKLYQQSSQSDLLIDNLSSMTVTNSITDEHTLKSKGFTTKAGLGVSYYLSKSVSFGLEYQYFQRIGKEAGLIDLNALSIGDLAGALKIIPAEVNIDIFTASLIIKF